MRETSDACHELEQSYIASGMPNMYATQGCNEPDELIFLGGETRSNTVVLAGSDSCIVSDVGNRTYNQDSALVMRHPTMPDFKLVAVADGMGGLENGAEFSAKTIRKLRTWFSNLHPMEKGDNYCPSNPSLVQESLRRCISNIERELREELYGINGGTTLAAAVICKDHIVLLNIGDSRIYNYNNNQLTLLTEDQSQAWRGPEYVDLSRFSTRAQYITNSLPGRNYFSRRRDSYKIIPKEAIGHLVLCTDGVSDMLSQEMMKNIMYQNQNSIEGATSRLVEYALVHNAYLDETPVDDYDEYYEMLPAGKDNATVAVVGVKKRTRHRIIYYPETAEG